MCGRRDGLRGGSEIQLPNRNWDASSHDDDNFQFPIQFTSISNASFSFGFLADSARSVPNDCQTYQMRRLRFSACQRAVSSISSVCCRTWQINRKIVSISTFTRPYKVSYWKCLGRRDSIIVWLPESCPQTRLSQICRKILQTESHQRWAQQQRKLHAVAHQGWRQDGKKMVDNFQSTRSSFCCLFSLLLWKILSKITRGDGSEIIIMTAAVAALVRNQESGVGEQQQQKTFQIYEESP